MTELLTSAPILETERLILRGPVRSDLTQFTRFVTCSPTMKKQEETVSSEEAWFGFFTLTLHGGHLPLGRVRLLKHSNWPEVELAWHLFEGAEGNGYATEAAQAVRYWAY